MQKTGKDGKQISGGQFGGRKADFKASWEMFLDDRTILHLYLHFVDGFMTVCICQNP